MFQNQKNSDNKNESPNKIEPRDSITRPKRAQTISPQSIQPIETDSIAATISKDDSVIDTQPKGMEIRRSARGPANKRRPSTLI